MDTYTIVHVAISLIGIGSGFVVMWGLLSAKRLDGWTALFLATTILTSVTGFGFPYHGFLPSYAVGLISLVVLAVAVYARYSRRLAGGSRRIYVAGAVIAQYLNFFVLIAQSFQKVPALKALAPTQSEPPFLITQLVALVAFVALGIMSSIRFSHEVRREWDREVTSSPAKSRVAL